MARFIHVSSYQSNASSGGNGGTLDGANIAFYIYMDCRYRISWRRFDLLTGRKLKKLFGYEALDLCQPVKSFERDSR